MSSPPIAVGRRPSQFAAIVRYTLQSCLPPRRWAAVLWPCVGAVLFGLLSRALNGPMENRFANVAAEAIFSLTMPITALIVGDAVLGAEVRAGTFHFTFLSPVRIWRIVLGRWLGGAVVVTITVGASCVLAALVAGAPDEAVPALVAGVAGAVAYVALFIAIGCITRRTAVWSLAIVFLVERLLGAALTGIAQISPTWLSRSAFVGLLDDPPERLVRTGIPDGWGAVVRLAVVAAISLGVAIWRMGHMRHAGASD
jgi:ABC-type transport system involved in multi-copper enzyme maturation permease subunit